MRGKEDTLPGIGWTEMLICCVHGKKGLEPKIWRRSLLTSPRVKSPEAQALSGSEHHHKHFKTIRTNKQHRLDLNNLLLSFIFFYVSLSPLLFFLSLSLQYLDALSLYSCFPQES
jgi:hypothetical protein